MVNKVSDAGSPPQAPLKHEAADPVCLACAHPRAVRHCSSKRRSEIPVLLSWLHKCVLPRLCSCSSYGLWCSVCSLLSLLCFLPLLLTAFSFGQSNPLVLCSSRIHSKLLFISSTHLPALKSTLQPAPVTSHPRQHVRTSPWMCRAELNYSFFSSEFSLSAAAVRAAMHTKCCSGELLPKAF